MPALQLTIQERKAHRATAHHLEPVVRIGEEGLRDSVPREADAALNAHGLIKVRAFIDDRVEREALYQRLANELGAAPIQHIGKLFILWRPLPEKERSIDADKMPAPRDVKVLKYSKRGGQRPEVQHIRLLGNQRLSATGIVKRAKPKRISPKKRLP